MKSVKRNGRQQHAIIVLMLLVSLFVGIIIELFAACKPDRPVQTCPSATSSLGISGCLIFIPATTVRRPSGWFCLPDACIFARRPGALPVSSTTCQPAHLWCFISGHCHRHRGSVQRSGRFLPEGPALYRYPGYAAGRLQYLPGLPAVPPSAP